MPNKQKLVDPLSLNLYTYCNNNPVLYTDPTGHWPKKYESENVSGNDTRPRYYQPTNMYEAFLLQEVMSNPDQGYTTPIEMSDVGRGWLAADGWVKKSVQKVLFDGRKIELHWVYNTQTGQAADFKFVECY
jgi:hypothetical protein